MKSTSYRLFIAFNFWTQSGVPPAVYETLYSHVKFTSIVNREHFDYRHYIEHRQLKNFFTSSEDSRQSLTQDNAGMMYFLINCNLLLNDSDIICG